MTPNPTLTPATPPGPWVDEERCVCGALYAQHRSGVSFVDGCEAIRTAAGDRHESGGGGWRSRRAVLWAMRCIKLTDWYLTHYHCGELYAELDDGGRLTDGHGIELF